MSQREYDLVVFGATGFTGRLVAHYLSRHASITSTRWAIAGRSTEKLDGVARELAEQSECAVDVMVADSDDAASMERLARSTRVVITTVGPYWKHGEPLVAACAHAGTSYVDLAGEPEFVDRVVERYGDIAKNTGARLVSCCGFESVPHDLAVLATVRELDSAGPIEVESFVRGSLQFSGGSWHTAVTTLARFRHYLPARRRLHKQLAAVAARPAKMLPPRIRRDRDFGAWVCPLPTIDPDIVIRSARALPGYGSEFRYGHYVVVDTLPMLARGMAAAVGLAIGAQIGPVRDRLLAMHKQGEGPPVEKRSAGWFEIVVRGRSGALRATTRVSGGDPGYDESSKMIAEAGLCLAFDELAERSGALTPAEAMGESLIERLVGAGISFDRNHQVA